MKKETLKRLGVPAFFLLLFLIPALTLDTLILQVSSELIRRTSWIGRYVIGTGLWLTLAWLVVRVIDDIGWPLLFDQRSGYVIPRLFKDFVHTVVFAVAVGVILSIVFQTSLTGLITASGVVGLVLGFALRNTIADFFSGISLNLERSFTIGDRIQLESGERGFAQKVRFAVNLLPLNALRISILVLISTYCAKPVSGERWWKLTGARPLSEPFWEITSLFPTVE